ncbi:MAG TPA: type III-B CRISPR module RAMP protein Cmr1, partial [Deltaproteobacteria bacterium]|nr:type III-B CRISPR module RAMP protein Cmr1 [Deltaproteobacteria bacterium]
MYWQGKRANYGSGTGHNIFQEVIMAFYVGRFRDMETKEFEVEVVTPLFLGGADPRKAELRTPPIKGALRFWWRALYGSDDLEDMKEREGKIFGSTTRKASLSIQLEDVGDVKPALGGLPEGAKIKTTAKGRTFRISIIQYLAYGLCQYDRSKKRNVYIREHLLPGTKFKLLLSMKGNPPRQQILDSLSMLVRYGGLGSRSRNGFGSIHIPGMSDRLKREGALKSFSALSSRSGLFRDFPARKRWEDALSDIGKVYREARMSLEPRHSFKKRPLIAKPLIVKGEVNISERHSKPYFLHVNKTPDNTYRGQILFL